MMDYGEFKGPLSATVAYFVMYYCFLYLQSGTAFYNYWMAKRNAKPNEKVIWSKIKYDAHDKLSRTAERSVGNTMEQALPFLTAVWLHAVFVSPSSASSIAWVCYTFAKLYILTFCKSRLQLPSTGLHSNEIVLSFSVLLRITLYTTVNTTGLWMHIYPFFENIL